MEKSQKVAMIGAGSAGPLARAPALGGQWVRVSEKISRGGGAWLSAQSMSAVLLFRASDAADAFNAFAAHHAVRRRAA